MKTLLASCAAVALMAAPALAQSTIDPATPDSIPVEPQVEQTLDQDDMIQPETDVLPPEPAMMEDQMPSPDAGMVAETEADVDVATEETAMDNSEPMVTAEMAPEEGSLDAEVAEAELPEEYSTDDLNAVMLAKVNTVGTEIASMDSRVDVWVSEGSSVDGLYVPEGQGDIDADIHAEPQGDDVMEADPLTNDNPAAVEDESEY